MVDEGLVSVWTEEPPDVGEVLGSGYNRVGLDVEVTCVIPSTDSESRDMLQRSVLGVGLVTHGVTVVQADVERSLEGVIHVGASVPDPVCFVHLHVVHVHYEGDVH